MNKYLFSMVLLIVSVFFFTSCEKKGQEDFVKGKAAYATKDYKTAVTHFIFAAEQNNSEAQFMLAECYSLGHGVDRG